MGGSGLDRINDFQKFCGLGLDWIQFCWIRTGLGLKNFTIRSSLLRPDFSRDSPGLKFFPGVPDRQPKSLGLAFSQSA